MDGSFWEYRLMKGRGNEENRELRDIGVFECWVGEVMCGKDMSNSCCRVSQECLGGVSVHADHRFECSGGRP